MAFARSLLELNSPGRRSFIAIRNRDGSGAPWCWTHFSFLSIDCRESCKRTAPLDLTRRGDGAVQSASQLCFRAPGVEATVTAWCSPALAAAAAGQGAASSCGSTASAGSGVRARIFLISQRYSVWAGAAGFAGGARAAVADRGQQGCYGCAGQNPVWWGACALLFTSSSLESLRRRLCPNDTTAGPRLGSREQEWGWKNDFRIPVALWRGRLSEPKCLKADWVIFTQGTFLSDFTPQAEACPACPCCWRHGSCLAAGRARGGHRVLPARC